jgi:hypothetical protein
MSTKVKDTRHQNYIPVKLLLRRGLGSCRIVCKSEKFEDYNTYLKQKSRESKSIEY